MLPIVCFLHIFLILVLFYFTVHMCHVVCTVCVCLHAGVSVSKRDETDSDLIQLKTNTLFCLKTLSWKQASFPGYQREGQI